VSEVIEFHIGQQVKWVSSILTGYTGVIVEGPNKKGQYTIKETNTGWIAYGYAEDGDHGLKIIPV
jgi:hypothetical protein